MTSARTNRLLPAWGFVILAAVAARGVTKANEAVPVQLLEITSETAAGGLDVVIHASEPVPYTTRQPNARTIIVELQRVTAQGVRRQVALGGLVRTLIIEEPVGDGAAIRLQLSSPASYSVRADGGTIRLGLTAEPAVAVAKTVPTPIGEALAAPPLPPASRLQTVETLATADEVTVTLNGDGRLEPSSVHVAEHWPPRVVVDLPEVRSAVPGTVPVEIGPLQRIRVARHSDHPLVTRVVFDLEAAVPYRVEQGTGAGGELRVVFPLDGSSGPPAGPVEATPQPPTPPAVSPALTTSDAVPTPPDAPSRVSTAGETRSPEQDAAIDDLLAELATVGAAAPAPAPDEPDPSPSRAAPGVPSADAAAAPVVSDLKPDATAPDETARVVARAAAPEAFDALATGAALAATPGDAEVPTPAAVADVVDRAPETQPTVAATPPAAVASGTAPPAVAGALVPPRRFTEGVPTTRIIRRRDVTSAPQAQGTRQLTLGGGRQYTGSPVSMDFQNADLRSVLRTFAEISGLNIVIDPQVQGSVDVALVDVPWDQALDIILRANQLGYDVDGTVVRIAPLATLADEEEQRRTLAEQQALAGELVVLTRTLSYARASDLGDLITRAVLSTRGQVQTDTRTNTLIITDLQDRLGAAQELLDTLDRPEPQVEIEARIVQASQDYLRELGIEWGLTGRVASEIGNTTPLSFPNRGGLSGRAGGTQGPEADGVDGRALETENAGTAVNLRAPSATSAVGLTLAAVDGSLNLDVILSAAENDGEVRILSNPRVTTQNNVQATIIQGDQIPIQTVANNTVTVTFKDAALRLAVTPQITAADTVIMSIEIDNDFADFGREVNGVPPIVTQSANTTVQVANGETTVIGGIYESEQTQSNRRVPGLNRIPLLGWLFKSESDRQRTDELLIFLTPYIVR